MKIRTRLLAVLLALSLATLCSAQLQVVGDGGPGPVKAQHLTAELVSFGSTLAPGGTLQAGLVLTMEEKWHVYWLNAGDSGEPPHIHWTLPSGLTAAPLQFPAPTRLPLGPLMDFGYEDTAAFPVTFTAAPTLKPGPIHVDAAVDWLVCREVCIPGKAHLGLNLVVGPPAPAPQPVGAVGKALTLIPKPLPADSHVTVTGGQKEFVLTITGLPSAKNDKDAEFYPYDQDQIVNAADQEIDPLPSNVQPDGIQLRIQRSPELTQLPPQLHGLLKLSDTESYEFTAPVTPGEIAPTTPAITLTGKPTAAGSGAAMTALPAIGLAFLGGIILNLMPCVFPVLFLKGLALVQSSGEQRKHLRAHGLVYTLGILVSFWIIVAVLLGVRAGGSHAGWGFQLQSPVFLTFLAAGIFFFALSLAGLFDIGLSLTSVGGELAQKQGYTGSFFTGVLATVVATPCTGPYMGVAIGFALAQPAFVTFAIFTALALGLAAPYLLLSFQPAWTRLLPRPGAWMEVFKQITAVIFFATVIWLTYVYGSLFAGEGTAGIYRVALLLGCFLMLAIAGYTLGRWPARRTSTIAAILLAAIGLAIPLYQPKDTTLAWQPYSQQALDDARMAGHPVFIDFTAAWCLSCQVNEKLVLHSSAVQHQFSARNITLLRADWTKYDPAITQQLASIHRSGVPTYVLYPASPNAPADVLPELLTKDVVLNAIVKDTAKDTAKETR
ncbi:MAG TPA: thioredoxin family protein [Granulicella sp.]|jgi:thiol:disulfide interchange protein|nr:thioredoxin family protein [Granulicella sp.]